MTISRSRGVVRSTLAILAAVGLLLSLLVITAPALAGGRCHDGYGTYGDKCKPKSESASQSHSESESASESASVPESESASESASVPESESASVPESESASATEDTLGGNPTPGGQVPDTAVGSTTQIPATLLSVLFLVALSGMVVLRFVRQR